MWSKIWTVLVALSFALWFAVMVDRLGALYVVGFIVLAYVVHAASKPRPPQPPSQPPTPTAPA